MLGALNEVVGGMHVSTSRDPARHNHVLLQYSLCGSCHDGTGQKPLVQSALQAHAASCDVVKREACAVQLCTTTTTTTTTQPHALRPVLGVQAQVIWRQPSVTANHQTTRQHLLPVQRALFLTFHVTGGGAQPQALR